MAYLRSRSTVPAVTALFVLSAIGCQAILGIDDTTFQNADADSGIGDASPDTSTDAAAPVDGDADAAPTTPTIAFSPVRAFVNQGNELDVAVTLTRNGFSGDATLVLASVGDAGVTADGGSDGGGASGIGVAALTIPAGSNTGMIHVFASATADIGLTTLDFTLTAETPSHVSLPILVGGPSGTRDTSFGINGVAPAVASYQPVSLAIGDDDSIWLVNNTFKVLHYFADGTSDDTLNAKLATTIGTPTGSSARIAVRGTILLIGGNESGTASLLKLATTGDFDQTFFSGGVFQPKESASTAEGNITGVAFSPTGDILLSAVITGPTQNLGGVVYRVSGGSSEQFVIGTPFIPAGVGVDPNGNIGAGGAHNTVDGGTNLFGQAIDSTFHDAGLASIGNPADEYMASKALVTSTSQISIAAIRNHILPTGNLAAFSSTNGTSSFLYLQGQTGTWDQGFGANAAQADGKVYVTDNGGVSGGEHAFVDRIYVDGGVDPSFSFVAGNTGGNPMVTFNDLAVDSFGRLVAAGVADTNLYLTRAWP